MLYGRFPLAIIALFTTPKTRKQTKCPSTDEWTEKAWNIHNGTLPSHYKLRGGPEMALHSWTGDREVTGGDGVGAPSEGRGHLLGGLNTAFS